MAHGPDQTRAETVTFAYREANLMTPYIKAKSPLRGDRKPRVQHGAGMPRVEQRQREEVAATRRALKKAARREGKREIEEGE